EERGGSAAGEAVLRALLVIGALRALGHVADGVHHFALERHLLVGGRRLLRLLLRGGGGERGGGNGECGGNENCVNDLHFILFLSWSFPSTERGERGFGLGRSRTHRQRSLIEALCFGG